MNVILPGAVTVILIPLTIYFVRYYWDRRRWHAFEERVCVWARTQVEEGLLQIADDLTEAMKPEEWSALVVRELSEAGFEPTRIKELLEVAVSFAQGLASQQIPEYS